MFKKHIYICYHLVRELSMSDAIRVARDSVNTNLVDVLTKSMTASKKRDICGKFMKR